MYSSRERLEETISQTKKLIKLAVYEEIFDIIKTLQPLENLEELSGIFTLQKRLNLYGKGHNMDLNEGERRVELLERLDLKKLIEEQYGQFFEKYGNLKDNMLKIAEAVDMKGYGEFIAAIVAEKAYELAIKEKESELIEKYRPELEKFKAALQGILETSKKALEQPS